MIIGVDHLLDMIRTAVNITGDSVVTESSQNQKKAWIPISIMTLNARKWCLFPTPPGDHHFPEQATLHDI